ncbi:glycosyltransferase family protein [Mesonia phycicola]|uniref:glycosyl transferase family 1 n=1 Tax=Mesonia phycicola TaxID=579105 RepID=UPI00293725B9|nr:glycosyl transferase family 1 [Mesonia phycicola]
MLIVTYYWPPAGGPGVQRWLKFVKYLKNFGVDPIVYIPENPHYPIVDNSLVNEVAKDVTVIKQPILEPYQWASIFSKKNTETISSGIIQEKKQQGLLQKIMLWVRGNLFIPDARKFWIKPSVKFLSNYIEKNAIDTLITTGPPHSLHIIGLKLKAKTNVKWIADFRDPWTTIGYHHQLKLTKNSQQKHKLLESEVLNKANHIITTSYTTKKDFSEITTKPITVITNGFDGDIVERKTLDNTFSLAHIGSLLSERNPENLWLALKELITENKEFSEDFQLVFVGKVSEQVLNSVFNYGLKDYLTNVGYVSYQESVQYKEKSQVLLLLEIDKPEMNGIIPGKLFEYLQAKRPILAIGPNKWDAARIIKETNSGKYFNYSSKEKIKTQILKWYKAYQSNELQVDSSSEKIEKFSRKKLTKSLATIINQLS